MALFVFPLHRFGPEVLKADIVPRVISGGEALNGEQDVIQTDGGGRWEGMLAGLTLNKAWQERLWGAWTAHWSGGARVFAMPVWSLRTAPRPIAGNGPMRPSALVANDDIFPTSVAFAAPYIKAELVGAIGLRATQVSIMVTQGARIEAGMRFGYGYRAYKIERVLSRVGMLATCLITSPTREAIPDGAALNFDWPVVQCRIVVGQDLAAEMRWGRQGSQSVNFVEDFSDVA